MKLNMSIKVVYEFSPEESKNIRETGYEEALKWFDDKKDEAKMYIAEALECEPEDIKEINVAFENWEDD